MSATRRRKGTERGASMLIFAVTAPVLFSVLAMALDVGWAYYTAKKAQAAADAAVLAGVTAVMESVGPGGSVSCSNAGCQPAGPCPQSGNLRVACLYSAANGFSNGGSANSQALTIQADTSSNAPSVPNLPVSYWVQSVAEQQLPQWFSGLIGTKGLKPSIRSTAALWNQPLNGSLYLLNRATDCFASALNIGVVCGEDFLAVGFNTIRTDGGIYMASSNGPGLGLPSIAAGTIAVGSVTVQAPYTRILGNGGIQNILAGTNWSPAPKNGYTDASLFSDPFAGKGQPPAPTGLPDHPVPGGIITGGSAGSPLILPPGNYYATIPLLNTATGLPITILGNVRFGDSSGNPCNGFCDFVFYGGVITGALSNVTFSPGRYVFAGAQPVAGGPGVGLTIGANGTVQDLTPLNGGVVTENHDAGEIFIFTDKSYPGLSVPAALSGLSLPQVRAGISAGLNPQITLHGLSTKNKDVPSALTKFAPALIWQDQANTTLRYTGTGVLDTSCGGICSNTLSVPGSQEMILQASQNGGRAGVNLYGTIYGPRGSWLTILGLLPGDTVAGPLQIVTGALQMTLNASLNLQSVNHPPNRLVASLIQ